jgi:hypothetical protein
VLLIREGTGGVRQVNVTGLIAAAFTLGEPVVPSEQSPATATHRRLRTWHERPTKDRGWSRRIAIRAEVHLLTCYCNFETTGGIISVV